MGVSVTKNSYMTKGGKREKVDYLQKASPSCRQLVKKAGRCFLGKGSEKKNNIGWVTLNGKKVREAPSGTNQRFGKPA